MFKRLCAGSAVALFFVVAGSASAAPYDPHTVIVKLRPGAAAGSVLARAGATTKVSSIGGVGAAGFRGPPGPAGVGGRAQPPPPLPGAGAELLPLPPPRSPNPP